MIFNKIFENHLGKGMRILFCPICYEQIKCLGDEELEIFGLLCQFYLYNIPFEIPIDSDDSTFDDLLEIIQFLEHNQLLISTESSFSQIRATPHADFFYPMDGELYFCMSRKNSNILD